MKTIKLIAICVLLVLIHSNTKAQSLPVGTIGLEDYYRRAQLLGITDTNVSFTVRPIFPTSINKQANSFYTDSIEQAHSLMNTDLFKFINKKKFKFQLLPVSVQTQFNSDHPYGWNDGAMIPAKGMQTLVSAGFFASFGPLSIQLKPEYVYAANTDFENLNNKSFDVVFARYYDIYNNIDLPVQFGTGSFKKLYWGQSSIRLNYKALSVGLSSENLWWGPGIQNSLLMSNTAPGFAHLTLNTTRPIKTPIGSFEGQIIAGRLENSGFPPLEPGSSFFTVDLYVPKPDDWRYLTGLILTWQPKWIPGLFLGFDQSQQTYGKNLSGIRDYLPLFSPIKNTTSPDNPIAKQDQVNSVFMRWLWTQEHAELYFEFGQYNNTSDFLQSLLEPNNTRAYVFGLRKLLPFNKSNNENILVGVEVAQLAENSTTNILNGTEWYVSQNIRQGYTNFGQELGAGIGPGGNLQTVDISWVKGLKKLGLQFERYIHNDDLYYYTYTDTHDFRRHWTDLSIGFNGSWNYKSLIFNLKIQGIKSLDYQWYLPPDTPNSASALIYFVPGTDAFNLQIQTGIAYRF